MKNAQGPFHPSWRYSDVVQRWENGAQRGQEKMKYSTSRNKVKTLFIGEYMGNIKGEESQLFTRFFQLYNSSFS
ncbi:hypothetical protein FKM82_022474 [Ascaphus truei]